MRTQTEIAYVGWERTCDAFYCNEGLIKLENYDAADLLLRVRADHNIFMWAKHVSQNWRQLFHLARKSYCYPIRRFSGSVLFPRMLLIIFSAVINPLLETSPSIVHCMILPMTSTSYERMWNHQTTLLET